MAKAEITFSSRRTISLLSSPGSVTFRLGPQNLYIEGVTVARSQISNILVPRTTGNKLWVSFLDHGSFTPDFESRGVIIFSFPQVGTHAARSYTVSGGTGADVDGPTYIWTPPDLSSARAFGAAVAALEEDDSLVNITIKFIDTLPVAPARPTVRTTSSSNVEAWWVAPVVDADTPIIQYNLRYQVQGSLGWTTRNVGNVLRYDITGLEANTVYQLQVQAVTVVGASDWSELVAQRTQAEGVTAPSRLGAPTVAALSTSSLRATWAAPTSNGGRAIEGYAVRWRRQGTSAWEVRNLGNVLTFDITGLTAGQTYEVGVSASNGVRSSLWSPNGTGTTNSEPVGNAPVPTIDSVLVGYSNFRASYFWVVSYSDNPRVPHDIRMRWRLQGAVDWDVKDWTSIGALAGRSVSTTPASITSVGTYEVQIQTSLDEDTGPLSAWTATRNVQVGAPSAPATPGRPAVTPLSQSSLRATWVRPNDGGAAIARFNLRYRKQGAGAWINTLNVGNVLTYDITGLDPSSTYEVQVQAVNSAGSSNFSASGTGTTNTPPTTPPSRTVIASVSTDGNNALIARWTPPAAGTSAITNYDVRHRREGTTAWTTNRVDADARSYRVAGLTGGTTYEFQVRAISAHGNGTYSATVTGTATSATVPGVPTITAVDPRENAMLVTITAPVSDGGSAVLWYDIQYGALGGGLTRFSRWLYAAGQGAITGLSRGTTYRLQVRAVNAQGAGPWTAAYEAATLGAVPGVPTGIALTPGNGEIAVVFRAPTNNGGSVITRYDIQHKLASASNWTTTQDVTSPHIIRGLQNGDEYDVQVRAVNARGNGPWSATEKATPDASSTNVVVFSEIAIEQPEAVRLVPPGDPAILLITPDNHTLLVNWEVPEEGGTHPIEYYDVRHRSGVEWTFVDRAARDTEYLIRGLANEIPVDVQVRAVSEGGIGPWSESVRGIPDVQYHQPAGILKALSLHGNVWGISTDGVLYNTHDLSDAWHDFAKIPKHETPVTDMLVYRNAGGEPTIYVTTETGVWVLDRDNERFLQADMHFPRSPGNGQGSLVWRGDLYIPAGLAIYRFTAGVQPVVSLIGPDRLDGGIPWPGDSRIVKLVPSHNAIIVVVQNTETEEPYAGTSRLLSYTGGAYLNLWQPPSHVRMTDAIVSTIYGEYSAWVGTDEGMVMIDLPKDIINPSILTPTRRYGESGEAITPWFTASKLDVPKLARELKLRTTNLSLSETIAVDYALDYADRWIRLGVLTTEGVHSFDFPSSAEPVGVPFDAIRFRFTEARGDDVALSPDLRGMALRFVKHPEAKWGFQVVVDLYADDLPDDARDALIALSERPRTGNPMVSLRYRNSDSAEYTYYVEVDQAQISEPTGPERGGVAILFLREL